MRRHSVHADPEVLAELSEGLISGKRATRIHAHLAGCQRCARCSAGLAEISMLLASVPSPAMPEAVVRRLSTTLVQEATSRSGRVAAATRPAEENLSAPVLRFQGARGRRRGGPSPVAARAFAAAAAACVVAAGGYTLVQLTSGPGPGPRQVAGGPSVSSSPTRGTHAIPLIPLTPSQGTGTSNLLSFRVIDSGIDYRGGGHLGPQIKTELDQVAALSPAGSSGARVLHSPTPQQYACVVDVTGDVEPALVDSARYDGRPATIIALGHLGNQVSQAWVVGPSCSADDTDILQHVTLPAPGG
ncbi:MAG TPA: hypothetical protein VGD68_01255 [Streptosporangiaceae bacterium]